MEGGSTAQVRGMARRPNRSSFFLVVASVFLALVLVAFSTTFYLRPFTGVKDRLGAGFPAHLLFHGIVLTAWFAIFVLQSALVRGGRVGSHRVLGRIGILIAILVVVSGVQTSYLGIHRTVAVGLPANSETPIVIGNFVSMLFFTGLFAFAVKYRRYPETHKRLMLFASLTIMGPTFGGPEIRPLGDFLFQVIPRIGSYQADPYLVTTVMVFLAVAIFDKRTKDRVQVATLVGGGAVFVRILLARTIASTELGENIVRQLA